MAHLILIRGVPGSGKTTLANSFGDHVLYAADDWFDEYNRGAFDARKLDVAHGWCLDMVRAHLNNGDNVIVHNTFTTERELKPYIDFAKEKGHTFTVIVVENRHGNKSVHNVPEEKVNQMRERLRGSIQL
jgi:predicted kinase